MYGPRPCKICETFSCMSLPSRGEKETIGRRTGRQRRKAGAQTISRFRKKKKGEAFGGPGKKKFQFPRKGSGGEGGRPREMGISLGNASLPPKEGTWASLEEKGPPFHPKRLPFEQGGGRGRKTRSYARKDGKRSQYLFLGRKNACQKGGERKKRMSAKGKRRYGDLVRGGSHAPKTVPKQRTSP